MSSKSTDSGKGYGSGSYGSDPYGFIDTTKPTIASVSSTDGTTIRVVFSEPVKLSELLSKDNWVLESVHGNMPEITSVQPSKDTLKAVDIFHTGTTLGCLYSLTCLQCFDLSGNAQDIAKVPFFAKGNIPEVSVETLPENKVLLGFSRPLGEGFGDVGNYLLTTDYPVTPNVLGGSFEQDSVTLYCQGMTSVEYDLTIGSASAFSGSVVDALEQDFLDASGRLDKTSTYQISATLDHLHIGCSLVVSDGEASLTIGFEEKTIRLSSAPSLDFAVTYEWSSHHNITLIRNQSTGHIALLVDGDTVFSGSLTDIQEPATFAAGVRVSSVSGVSASVSATASNTLFLADGNFVHELKAKFLGLDDLAKNRIQVKRGPLTKGWGDATPAGINDVSIRVNGVNSSVVDVNPYLGLIYLETPVPKMPVGEIAVEVDYYWFENPQMSFQSLNHPGLVLNKWDQRKNPEVQSDTLAAETIGGGSVEGERYPISLTLMRPPRVKPKWVSHRHIGFDKSYTASLNSPNALVLNSNPLGGRKRKRYDQMSQNGQFEGFLSEKWFGRGNLTLQAGEDGYSTLSSDLAAAVAHKVDLNPVGAQVTLVGRARCSEAVQVSDRLGLGPAIAFHDSKDLRLLAAVEIDGISHIAMLTGNEIDNPDSWQPVHYSDVRFLSGGRIEVPEQELPELFGEGLRVVVPVGEQAGSYTVQSVEKLSTGDYWVYVTPDFPFDVNLWGGGEGTVYFEAPWKESAFNLHLVGRADNAAIGVSFTGATSFQRVVDIPSVSAHNLYGYGDIPLDLTEDGRGEVLFGNLVAGGSSDWDFVRYITVPDDFILSSIGHLETLTLADVPSERSLWRKTSSLGQVSTDGDLLTMKSEGGIDQKLGFEKLDALIPRMGGIEVSAEFQVTHPNGWGDAGIRVGGPNHDVLLSTIPYTEDGIFKSSSVSLIGSGSFDEQGWRNLRFQTVLEGSRVHIEKVDRQPCSITNELPNAGASKSRSLQTRLTFQHATYNDLDDAGFIIGIDANDKTVALLFAKNKLILTSDGTTYLGEVAFDWLDNQQHSYHIKTGDLSASGTDVELWVDGISMLKVPLADFDGSGSNVRVYMLGFGIPEFGLDVHSLQYQEAMPLSVKKTLGIWKGGEYANLDSWELPTDDDGNIVEMDWQNDQISVMLVVDPAWGVSLLRPDLPTPPYDTKGRTSRHDSKGAWATVEWEHLPFLRSKIANLHFGMQNPAAQSESVWDHFRYRVYIDENEDKLPPRHAVLNRWNVLSSGEYTGDITLENARLKIRGDLILVTESNITAKRVFHVAVNGTLLSQDAWSFDPQKQTIKLDNSYSRSSVAEITFSPGRPITKSYLLNQPLKDGITNLNEGTPPYLLTQLSKLQRQVLNAPPRADEAVDPIAEDPAFEANDPTRLVEFSHDSAYSSVDFFQVDNGAETGVLSTPDDGIAPAKGLAHIDLHGRMFAETLAPPPAYPFEQGGGAPGAFLVAGGGSGRNTGSLGGGAVQGAVTWASNPSRADTLPSLARNRTFWEVRDHYSDAVDSPETVELTYEMVIGASYSRTGPWGGAESLNPTSLLNGGEHFNGMVLSGGSPLPEPTRIRRRFNANDNIWTD